MIGIAEAKEEIGETAGIRTQDPRLKRPLLYQLSYRLMLKSRTLPSRPPAVNPDIRYWLDQIR